MQKIHVVPLVVLGLIVLFMILQRSRKLAAGIISTEGYNYPTVPSLKATVTQHPKCVNDHHNASVLLITSMLPTAYLPLGQLSSCSAHVQPLCTYIPWPQAQPQLHNMDAVIFRPFYMSKKSGFYTMPHPCHQKWVFFEEEAPYRTWNNYSYHLDVWREMNITVTFTADADIQHYLLAIQCHTKTRWRPSGRDYARAKTGGVLWIVSNCHSTAGRELYVKELQKYIKVDVFGKCGNGSICGHKGNIDRKCMDNLIGKYRFYLAFENSFCEDYYTEKIGKLMNVDVIPVVMGLVNYTRLLSPGTFIDVRDFRSPRDLAKYLHYLSTNHTAYNEYIERKHQVSCRPKFMQPLICVLCDYLYQHRGETQVKQDARDFWGVNQKCHTPQQFFEGVANTILPNLHRIDFKV